MEFSNGAKQLRFCASAITISPPKSTKNPRRIKKVFTAYISNDTVLL
jgi:hypothetical protein